MTNKKNPDVITYRQDEFQKYMERIESKLDRVIENYATKIELSEAVNERNEKISSLAKHFNERFDNIDRDLKEALKKRTTTALIASIISVISLLTAVIALYELFT